MTRDEILISVILMVQVFCTVFFVYDIVSSVLGLRATPIAWHAREIIEIGAAVGLVLGVLLGGLALRRHHARRLEAETRLRRASSAFMEVVDEHFTTWRLTPAEKDVALFLLKGQSIAAIAEMRATSEGTVKAQSGAIYRKAGVSSASQLLSVFMDDLMDDEAMASVRDAPVT